jgi:hypothetical protein
MRDEEEAMMGGRGASGRRRDIREAFVYLRQQWDVLVQRRR